MFFWTACLQRFGLVSKISLAVRESWLFSCQAEIKHYFWHLKKQVLQRKKRCLVTSPPLIFSSKLFWVMHEGLGMLFWVALFSSAFESAVFSWLRVENLEKFKSGDGDCPTLVCTDLAARGLDLNVDHVIMFDFPSNSVSIIYNCFVSILFILHVNLLFSAFESWALLHFVS